ncbi:MAG TPA: hypothetical protein VF339_02905 [Gammaproteobacteria bacterium]
MSLRRLEHALVRERIEEYSDMLARFLDDVAADPRLGPHVAAAARRSLDDMRRALLEEFPYAADLLPAEVWPRRAETEH